jgi:hypothetical protein
MPELSLSDDQYGRLEEVRREVEAAFVDSYGHTRPEDAIAYLLDTYTPPAERQKVTGAYDRIATAEYPALQRVASDVEGVPGSNITADEMRGKLLVELDPEEFAARLEAGTDDATDLAGDDSPTEQESTSDDGGPLSAVNRLLDEHDDRWRESDGDNPYEVDLPDGSTESVRTKDDVRRLLFRHY